MRRRGGRAGAACTLPGGRRGRGEGGEPAKIRARDRVALISPAAVSTPRELQERPRVRWTDEAFGHPTILARRCHVALQHLVRGQNLEQTALSGDVFRA